MGKQGRPKKDNKTITIRMATPVFNMLNEYCDESGLTKTMTIEKAVERYIKEQKKDAAMLKKMKK